MASLRSLVRPFARLLHSSAPRLQQQNGAQDAAGELKTIVEETIKENYPTPRTFITPSTIKFDRHSFFRPFQLHRQYQSKNIIRPKRPYLGPGRAARETDVFLQLSIDPRRECDNAQLMSSFVTSMGKIKSRAETRLTTRSQRLLTKAIKRAKMMGVIPRYSRLVPFYKV